MHTYEQAGELKFEYLWPMIFLSWFFSLLCSSWSKRYYCWGFLFDRFQWRKIGRGRKQTHWQHGWLLFTYHHYWIRYDRQRTDRNIWNRTIKIKTHYSNIGFTKSARICEKKTFTFDLKESIVTAWCFLACDAFYYIYSPTPYLLLAGIHILSSLYRIVMNIHTRICVLYYESYNNDVILLL